MSDKKEFSTVDYVVFALSLAICVGMGIITAIRDACKKTSAQEALTGGKSMGIFPVSMSVLASFLAAPFVLGTPAEMYFFGTQYAIVIFGFGLATPIIAHVFIPLFHNLNVVNGYEYLERRFNHKVRLAGSITFAFMMILYMGVVVYAPALAFSQVTDLPLELTVLAVGITCTIYTAAGGLKAVIWIDVIQMCIILAGLIALTVKGLIDTGGFEKVWNTAYEGGRLEFDNISPHPHERHTIWTQTIGAIFTTMVLIGCNQAIVQKYLSVPKLSHAQLTPYFAFLLLALYMLLVCFIGLIMYTYYIDCDPWTQRKVQRIDQMIPLFVMDVLGPLLGIPGLFTAAVFSATLSTVAAGVNALAAITYVDGVVPIMKRKGKTMTPRLTTIVTKLLAVFYGGVTIGLAYLAPLFGEALLQIAISIFGVAGGPLLGMFLLGMFFPFVNTVGTLIGLIVSLILSFWMAIGAITTGVPASSVTWLPLNASCPSENATLSDVTMMNTMTPDMLTTGMPATPPTPNEGGVHNLYKISYMWYTVVSVLITVVVAIIASVLADCISGGKTKVGDLQPGLIVKCCPCQKTSETEEEFDNITNGHVISEKDPAGQENLGYVSNVSDDFKSSPNLYPQLNGFKGDVTQL